MSSETTANEELRLAIDASIAIAFCAKEPDKYHQAFAALQNYVREGYRFYAPGALISEVLFVLCKMVEKNQLTREKHDEAVAEFLAFMAEVAPPPNGDRSLIARTVEIRSAYSCKRTTDAIYIALAEALATANPSVLLTFDQGIVNHAKNAAGVNVNLLSAT